MSTKKKVTVKPAAANKKFENRADLFIRANPEIKKRVEILSAKMGYTSANSLVVIMLELAATIMENPDYWFARVQGIGDAQIAGFITEGLKARRQKKDQ